MRHILVHKPKLLVLRVKSLPISPSTDSDVCLERVNSWLRWTTTNHALELHCCIILCWAVDLSELFISHESGRRKNPTPLLKTEKKKKSQTPQEFQFCLMGSLVSVLLTFKEHW